MPIRYKPYAGSTESRVVELLRFLPAGTALHGGDLDTRLGIGERRGLHTKLYRCVSHGLLRAEKREDSAGRLRMHWMAGNGAPHHGTSNT